MAECGSLASNVPNKLISRLFNQKEAGQYCDISMRFGQVELRAHACVIAAFSPHVNDLLSGEVMAPASAPAASVDAGLWAAYGTRASSLTFLEDSSFSCLDCAKKVIAFMYVGKILIDDLHLDHIKAVSESLQVSELLKICRKHSDKCVTNKPANDSIENSIGIETSALCSMDEVSNSVSKPPCPDKSKHLSNLPVVPKITEIREMKSCLVDSSVTASDDLMDESEWNGMKCPKCELDFMSLAMYQLHCGTHLGKTFTTCYVCNYASIRVPDVIKHLQDEGHGEKVCSICLLEVNSCQSLKEHLLSHDQLQPFFCLTCNTRFQTRTALNSHIVRHTSETPFVCKECGRGFKWKHGLRNHMVTHSKLKSFLCDQCGFSTAHLRSFIDHKVAHSEKKFKCPKPDCEFTSLRRESVRHHLMTHSKQKPYQCEVCGQAFSQAKNLRRHAVCHNPSADPEKCPLCPYQTNRSDKFKAHFKRYHKDGEKGNQRNKRKSSASSNNMKSSTTSSNLNEKLLAKSSEESMPNVGSSQVLQEALIPNTAQTKTIKPKVVPVDKVSEKEKVEKSSGSLIFSCVRMDQSNSAAGNEPCKEDVQNLASLSNSIHSEEGTHVNANGLNFAHPERIIGPDKLIGTGTEGLLPGPNEVGANYSNSKVSVKNFEERCSFSGPTSVERCEILEVCEISSCVSGAPLDPEDNSFSLHSCCPRPALEPEETSIKSVVIQSQQEASDNLCVQDVKSINDDNELVILNADDVLSLSDAVCVIPDGTYMIMDVESIAGTAISEQHSNPNDILFASFDLECSTQENPQVSLDQGSSKDISTFEICDSFIVTSNESDAINLNAF